MHRLKRLFLQYCRTGNVSKYSSECQRYQHSVNFKNELEEPSVENKRKEITTSHVVEVSSKEKLKKYENEGVGFWKSDQGLQIYEQTMTGVGRVLRMFVSKERYDNFYESALMAEYKWIHKMNHVDNLTLEMHGPEWAMGQIVFNLGGAVKLLHDDRWVDDVRHLRTPKKKDYKAVAIDLRRSNVNDVGLVHLKGLNFLRYLNVADSEKFDDYALAALHPVSDSLEFLDISGTAVTERGFSYLRLFHKLVYLNISRLKKAQGLEQLLPFIQEILPRNCIIVMNDEQPSDSYGYAIPFRSTKNPRKDLLVTTGNRAIGNLAVFQKTHGNEVDLYNPDHIHELWMTPKMSSKRRLRHHNLNNNYLFTLVKYIKKAEKYQPLL